MVSRTLGRDAFKELHLQRPEKTFEVLTGKIWVVFTFLPEDEGSRFIPNVGNHLTDYKPL
jgi:hypothetical protein